MSTVRRGDIVGPRMVEAAGWVVGALEGRGGITATEGNARLGAVLARGRMPDITSRLRRDLQAEGVVISGDGQGLVGTAYRHDASAPFRSEVRARAVRCAAAAVDFICLAEAGSR